jgi:RNA-directed DNA polymerase
VGSQAAAQRTLTSIQDWIEKRLRLKVNSAKSGTGRVWERKFLGFRLNRQRQIGIAPESIERFKAKVREQWRSRRSLTSTEVRDRWKRFLRGWWEYFQLAEDRQSIFRLEGWIRRHMRKYFWWRWHNKKGRERNLRKLGVKGALLRVASSARGAWRVAAALAMQSALTKSVLRIYGFLMPSDLAAQR